MTTTHGPPAGAPGGVAGGGHDVLGAFFEHYYRRHPVNATFTGIHEHDDALPDWGPSGLESAADEMRALDRALAAVPQDGSWLATDAELARGYLAIRQAEDAGPHGVGANPALWTGEGVFAAVSLMLRPSLPMHRRALAVAARLEGIPVFLAAARRMIGSRPVPEPWLARALRDCAGADRLLGTGIAFWLKWLPRPPLRAIPGEPSEDEVAARVLTAAELARAAFGLFSGWLRARRAASERTLACGGDFFDLLLSRGHFTRRTRADLLADALARFDDAVARLDAEARNAAGSWAAVQERLATAHPQATEYLPAFERTWTACRQRVDRQDLVTWPEGNSWPLRYVLQPEWARDAAPFLYFLPYRSPAPDDAVRAHDYLVAPIDAADPDQHLRTWNHAVIKLNHVVHHGAIGHHVQNWHAYHRSHSRVGRVAAVDCASRIGMYCGGTMAEGWACYAGTLMEETGFLTPLEKVSEQHSRVRFLARAIVDISLHQGTMTFAQAVAFYTTRVGMSEAAARNEATKNSMFPGTGLMYWLGTQGILELREELKRRQGAAFSLKRFHDDLLAHGSVPVPLVARRMLEGAS